MSVAAAQTAPQAAQHPGFFASHFGHQQQVQPTYLPAAATTTGYQQYVQYTHAPGFQGPVLQQQQFIAADANHDGKVSGQEIQNYATAHHIYAQPGTQTGPITTYMPSAATAQGYQTYMNYAHMPQYHAPVLTQSQYIAADANHDGKISQTELNAAVLKAPQSMEITNIKVTGGKLSKSGMADKADPYVYFVINPPGWFNKITGKTSHQKNNTQPSWVGEAAIKLEKFEKPEALEMEVSVYDKDMFKDDKLGGFKVALGPLMSKGHIREKVDNNLFAEDVYLEFDYTTTWGPEPPPPKKKKASKKKKKSKDGCC